MDQKTYTKYPEFPVLVVDDEDHVLTSIKSTLEFNEITNVEPCQDSEKVMYLLKSQQYSLVLLDLVMPGISGMDLLPKIVEEFPEIPVIALTGLNMTDIVVKCIKLGAFDYLVKPLDSERLIKTIRMALDSKKTMNNKVPGQNSKNGDVNHTIESLERSPTVPPTQEYEADYKTTIYFSEKPPDSFSENKEGIEREKEFLTNFFQLKNLKIEINIKGKVDNMTARLELKDMNGLIFSYLAYKNYKALKNPQYQDWKDIPASYEFRLSGNPRKNNMQKPEWKILSEYLDKIERTPDDSTIRQWVKSLNDFLKNQKGEPNIIETTRRGRGRGYLLKGVVEFSKYF